MGPGHPAEALRARRGHHLDGRTVALGVDGARGAPGAVRVARELLRLGAEVVPLMNPSTPAWVPADALEYATGRAPATWPTHATYDAVLLAPAGQATVDKLRLGLPDSAPVAAALGHLGRAPVLVAPAPGVDAAPAADRGARVLAGAFDAHGEPRPERVAAWVAGALSASPLAGRQAWVVAGGAFAPWDAMRVVGAPGDAAAARALALELERRGARVRAVLGPWGAPHDREERAFETLDDLAALAPLLGRADVALVEEGFPAWGPAETARDKLPSGRRGLALPLQALPAVEALLRGHAGSVVHYGAEGAPEAAAARIAGRAEAALA